jgi:hypothetical protein
MFAVYKKIISPESSPVLGPASPNLAPMTNGVNANNANNANNATNATNANNNGSMETLSLCNYCCSPRIKMKKVDDAMQDPMQGPMQDPIKSKYEFGHATHYVYGVTTPRLLCDFETGTPP